MSAFDRAAVVAALPVWDWQSPAPATGALADYARYYHLDRLPARHGIGYLDSAGYRIAMQSWRHEGGTPAGTVLVLHGYFDHVGIFDHVIESLLASGYDVITFDLPGHGLSSGEPAAIGDFVEYQTVLHKVLEGMADLPQPWHVVAQSTGGAVVMEYLLATRGAREPLPFAGIVLLAPLVRPVNWRTNSLIHRLVSPFRRHIGRKFAINSHDEEFLDFLRNRDPLQARALSLRWVGALKRWIPRMEAHVPLADARVTVVQGTEDRTVDWQHNLGVIREKFPGVVIHMIGQGRHQLVNESPALRTQVFDRIADALRAGN